MSLIEHSNWDLVFRPLQITSYVPFLLMDSKTNLISRFFTSRNKILLFCLYLSNWLNRSNVWIIYCLTFELGFRKLIYDTRKDNTQYRRTVGTHTSIPEKWKRHSKNFTSWVLSYPFPSSLFFLYPYVSVSLSLWPINVIHLVLSLQF